jgi:probable phosphoglycerate mutase
MSRHTIYFVRHGQTDWNAARRFQGQTDTPLNDSGRAQARRNGEALAGLIAHELAHHDFVASPLARTRETMEILRAAMGLPVTDFRTDDRLKEMHYGRWEGRTWHDLVADPTTEFTAWRAEAWSRRTPEGESYADVSARVVAWLAEVERDTVCVAHGGIMRVLRGHLGRLPAHEILRLDVPQDQVLVLSGGAERWV